MFLRALYNRCSCVKNRSTPFLTTTSLHLNCHGVGIAVCRTCIALFSVIALALCVTSFCLAAPCTDTWVATSTTGAPDGRMFHTAVWTGTEMIVFGGFRQDDDHYDLALNTGGRYKPGDNSWTPINGPNPSFGRMYHTAVWTGSEMIVWGGLAGHVLYNETNNGGRYDPRTNTWKSMSSINAPTARTHHTAIWTGSEMIVWGGEGSGAGTGGKYNPATDTWETITTVNAPSGRYWHSVVWTGTEMIVWGGLSDGPAWANTGARYNPGSNTWIATSLTNAPVARGDHSAVWTGSEMIVWGGKDDSPDPMNTGGRYNPVTDSWTATTTINAPAARYTHTAVWTGNEMIIWGGYSGYAVDTGGRYSPAQDSWAATSLDTAPHARGDHSALWTGSQMLIWGGTTSSGTENATVDSGGLFCASVPAQLLNIATRMRVLTGNNSLIGGFIVSGPDQKKVIVRGIGPSLTKFGVATALPDPVLELHDSTKMLASNDNWKATQETEVQTTGLAPINDSESAIVTTLPGNDSAYTVILSDKNGQSGTGLVEIYDLDSSTDSTLANISTRGFVDTDDNVMIGGLIVGSGDRGPAKVMVRGIGPSLSKFGISNSLEDPTLELRNGDGAIVATNDNWKVSDGGGSQENEINATGIAPTDGRESALVRTIVPDNYTAILRGKNNGTGVGLVEIYNLRQ